MQRRIPLIAGILICTLAVHAQLRLVDNIREGASSSIPLDLTNSTAILGEELYFPATGENTFRELYKSDGTTGGTAPLLSSTGSPINTPSTMIALPELVVFRAVTGGGINTLWRTDGTQEGTFPISNVAIGSILCIERAVNRAYFTASTSFDTQLWVTDGTEEGTKPLNDNTGAPITSACDFVYHTDGLTYFVGSKAGFGQELWVTDGSSEGTFMVLDLAEGEADGLEGPIWSFGDNIWFSANDGENGEELWASDGTEGGTAMFVNIKPGGLSGSPEFAFQDENHMYFMADDGTEGREMWRSDGTVEGTNLWAPINDGPMGSATSYFEALSDAYIGLFFEQVAGNELFTVSQDGEYTLVRDIVPGNGGIFIFSVAQFDDKVFFATDDMQLGRELWITDGTQEGTVIEDIQAGSAPSSPEIFGTNSRGVFLSATRSDIGRELFFHDGVTSSLRSIWNLDDFSLYPNPSTDRIHISSPEIDMRVSSVKITDIRGIEVMHRDGSALSEGIDVSALPGGLYMLTLIGEERSILTEKFVKN